MKTTIFTVILFLLTIFFFKEIEINLVHNNFSWTISKITPYFLMILFGFIFAIKLFKSKISRNKLLKFGLAFILFLAPFGLAFAFNPIYEGDFAKEGSIISKKVQLNEFKGSDLLVLTIQNCPFCRESVVRMNTLIKRNPQLKIKYIVCSKNPEATKELRSSLDKKIKIELAKNLDEIVQISGGQFPAFVKIENNKAVYKWGNMELGVRSLDWIESQNF